MGSEGWIRVHIPFVPPVDPGCRIDVGGNTTPGPVPSERIVLGPVNQYTLQGERFSKLIRGEDVAQWPLETAVANMAIIDALFRSEKSERWEAVEVV